MCAEAHGGCPVCPAGAEFEARILASEANNVKFNFLQPTDPYHAYYRMRVSNSSSCALLQQPPR